MGLRATSVKKYEIEYGNTQGFNYDPDTLASIIMDFCEDAYTGDDGCGGHSTDVIWSIDKNQFSQMTNELCEMSAKEFNQRMKEDWFWGTDDKPYTKKQVTDLFKGYYNDTPEDSNYVRIAWL